MDFQYSRRFVKQFGKLPVRVREKFKERLLLFEQDKFYPLLDNHKLHPPYDGCRSFDVTGDIRTVFEEVDGSVIRLIAIGTHSDLYE